MKRTIEIFLQPPVPGRDGYNRIPEKTIDSIVQKFPDFELKGYLTSSINARANEGDEKIMMITKMKSNKEGKKHCKTT
jgi:hypothetical protein